MTNINLRAFFQDTCFIGGAAQQEQFPQSAYPEVAFIGRSNVGKSSLINSLTSHGKLARVSKSPGRTQQINFYLTRSKVMLVDLPGYGYAAAAKSAVLSWNKLITHYLVSRAQLRQVMLLIDSRLGINKNDALMIEMLKEYGNITQLILTKTDKITASVCSQIQAKVQSIINKEACFKEQIISVSNKQGLGIEAVLEEIYQFI